MADKYNSKLAKLMKFLAGNKDQCYAFVFGQHAFYSCPEAQVGKCFKVHEDAHKAQYKKYGVLKFLYLYYKSYVGSLLHGKSRQEAHDAVPFEQEAKAAQAECESAAASKPASQWAKAAPKLVEAAQK